MRILYGVQGTGNGHIARARIMAKAFAEREDVIVDYLFSGRERSEYFDMEIFGQFRSFTGLTFSTKNGVVSRWQTLKSAKFLRLVQDIKGLDLSAYDLLINDFEPLSAWAAKSQNIPSISISHQAAFLHPIPKQGYNQIGRLLTKYFAPTDIQLGVHWYHFGHSIMPPFIDAKIDDRIVDKKLLVYLPFEDIKDIRTLLEPLAEHDFICFHPAISEHKQEANISWQSLSKEGFYRVLQGCSGVIANAGFELSSECLHLGKRLLIKPLQGQFEQLSNVRTLLELGLCHCMLSLDSEAVESWLNCRANEPIVFPTDPGILIDWLIKKEWQKTDELCADLWQRVRFPNEVLLRLSRMSI